MSFLEQRYSFALVAALTTALALDIAGPAPTAEQPIESRAGQLLVASPSIGDPRFARAVILMIRHDRSGAFGLIVNRPVEELSCVDLLAMIGEWDAAATGTVRLFAGGPVQPEKGFVIHSGDYHDAETVEVTSGLAMTGNRDVLRAIATGKGPRYKLIIFGYAGWGAGQLEGELRRRDWEIAPAEPKLVLEEDRESVWEAAFARRMQDL